jgi:hypothetical protein
VFAARKVAWETDPPCNTWGAFQAYGEPGWLAEPRGDGSAGTGSITEFVSPDELLDALARVRAAISLRKVRQTRRVCWPKRNTCSSSSTSARRRRGVRFRSAIRAGDDLAAARPAGQGARGVSRGHSGAGRSRARSGQGHRAAGERRSGHRRAPVEGRPERKSDREALRYIDLAISRLKRLGEIVSGRLDGDSATLAVDKSPDRNGLIGSAWKRKAGVYARQLLRRPPQAQAAAIGRQMEEALACSAAAYRSIESNVEDGRFHAYWSSTGCARSAHALGVGRAQGSRRGHGPPLPSGLCPALCNQLKHLGCGHAG